ncbi:hydrophobin precursor [Xylariaceae sp. FL1651]|nr:hydrophobin precursor [Xylariaceae sp. FL1651]
MQFSTLFITVLATAVMASPAKRNGSPYEACPDGVYSNLQCCATDVLGVADLDCASPSAVPSSAESFKAICAAGGNTARCCAIPVADQSVLCETPVGL